MSAVFANVWQRISDGEQFLGMPWRKEKRFCEGAQLADQPPPFCEPKYRRVGLVTAYPKARGDQ